MLLLVRGYTRVGCFLVGQEKLRKSRFIGPRMFFLMNLESDSIILFLLILRVLFMHLLVGSPVSVCCFSVDKQKLQIEFFVP